MTESATLKACCVDAYSSAAVRWLVGESLHPGGLALTLRLARSLEVETGSAVVDVACGSGASALAVAETYGCDVVGVDLARDCLALARERARGAGLDGRLTFLHGDAEALPLASESADAVLCECSLCLFPDRRRAAAELARVLRPGGRLALSDVTADARLLPPELLTLAARVACIAGAEPVRETVAVLEDAGFVVEEVEDHRETLVDLLDRVDERLRTATALLGGSLPASIGESVGRGLRLVDSARGAIATGRLGYAAVYGVRPTRSKMHYAT